MAALTTDGAACGTEVLDRDLAAIISRAGRVDRAVRLDTESRSAGAPPVAIISFAPHNNA